MIIGGSLRAARIRHGRPCAAVCRASRSCASSCKDLDGRDIGERSDAVLRTATPGHDVVVIYNVAALKPADLAFGKPPPYDAAPLGFQRIVPPMNRDDRLSAISGGRWLILAVLFLARTAMGLQFQAVAALSPYVIADLAIDYARLGWLIGLYPCPASRSPIRVACSASISATSA